MSPDLHYSGGNVTASFAIPLKSLLYKMKIFPITNLTTRILGLPVIVVDGATALAMVAFRNRLIAYNRNTRSDAVEAGFFPVFQAKTQPQKQPKSAQKNCMNIIVGGGGGRAQKNGV